MYSWYDIFNHSNFSKWEHLSLISIELFIIKPEISTIVKNQSETLYHFHTILLSILTRPTPCFIVYAYVNPATGHIITYSLLSETSKSTKPAAKRLTCRCTFNRELQPLAKHIVVMMVLLTGLVCTKRQTKRDAMDISNHTPDTKDPTQQSFAYSMNV